MNKNVPNDTSEAKSTSLVSILASLVCFTFEFQEMKFPFQRINTFFLSFPHKVCTGRSKGPSSSNKAMDSLSPVATAKLYSWCVISMDAKRFVWEFGGKNKHNFFLVVILV